MKKFQLSGWRAALMGVAYGIASPAIASTIVAPHGAGRDADLAGNTVAAPDDGGSALLINPAGVVSRARDEALVAVLPFNFSAEYRNNAAKYDGMSSLTPVGLDLWYGLGEIDGWSMGVGMYGSIGAAFNLPADTANGQTSRYTGKLSLVNLGFIVGREIAPGLRFGVQVSPRYGRQSVRLPSPLGDVDYQVDGVGYSASAGLVYTPIERWSLGLAYTHRGRVKMDGDGNVGATKQKVDVTLVTPRKLAGGAAYQWTDKLRVMGQLGWTWYEDFEDGKIEFHTSNMLNQPPIADATNRLRWGAGLEYEVVPGSTLRASYTQGKAMIDDSALKPNMFDHDNKMIMAGYEIDYGKVMTGFTIGYMELRSREVDSTTNPYFPGHYSSHSDISLGIHVTWKLDRPKGSS